MQQISLHLYIQSTKKLRKHIHCVHPSKCEFFESPYSLWPINYANLGFAEVDVPGVTSSGIHIANVFAAAEQSGSPGMY